MLYKLSCPLDILQDPLVNMKSWPSPTSKIHGSLIMDGHLLKHADCKKYHGLTVTKDLLWDKHVKSIVAKANNTLGFLWRNININNLKLKAKA